MWKYILSFCLFMALCFMVPSFFTDFSKVNIDEIDINGRNISGDVMANESGDKIKLLLSESNEIIELTMDDYIKGVVLR